MKTIAIISKTPWAVEIQERMASFTKIMSEEKQKIYNDVHEHLIEDGHIKAGTESDSYNVCFDPDADSISIGDCPKNPLEGLLEHLKSQIK